MSDVRPEFENAPTSDSSASGVHPDQVQQLLSEVVQRADFRMAVASRPRDAASTDLRVEARPVRMKAGIRIQFARRTATQEFHTNLTVAEAVAELQRLMRDVYFDVRLTAGNQIWNARSGRKHRWKIQTRRVPAATPVPPSTQQPDSVSPAADDHPEPVHAAPHNRTRQYLIPEGIPCPFLIKTGIMTKDGQVRTRHYRKFRQINRYLEFIHDVLRRALASHSAPPAEGASEGQPDSSQPTIRIVDFGCGKSYLTFATHYLLNSILKTPCRITGLDRRQDVVQTCQAIASDLQLQNINFEVGEIAGYQPDGPVDLVISLHACDTATDDALQQAVAWGSQVILAVPCCQHELAASLSTQTLPLMTDHGILRERFATMATDAMRAAVLEVKGYETSLMEFIEMEHTPKNVLIRAVKRPGSITEAQRQRSLNRLTEYRTQLQLPALKLERVLLSDEPIA